MKKFIMIFLPFFFISSFAIAYEGHDPTILAREQPSEYTEYLLKLFQNQKEFKVSPNLIKPKFKKGTSAYLYRTEIKNQSNLEKANFSGDWILVIIPQGTAAFRYFLANTQTGKVIDPHLMTTNGNPLFQSNRSLLVISGSVGEKTLEDAKKGVLGGPKIYEWKNNRLVPVSL
jgi:hypothetical protein